MKKGLTRLWILSGFLGSGKTSLLQQLLEQHQDKRIGLIINEWGSLNIDAALLPSGTQEKIIELSGGQIFCSCLSGSFVRSLVELSSLNLDYIITEASGLAKPSVLGDIIQQAQREVRQSIEYAGMIGIVDASRYSLLRQSVKAVDEQLYYSKLLYINKTDLISSEKLQSLHRELERDFPGRGIFMGQHGRCDTDILADPSDHQLAEADSTFGGWGKAGRPASCTLVPAMPPNPKKLEAFLSEISPQLYRVKGFTALEGVSNGIMVDCVGDQLDLKPGRANHPQGLVCIAPGKESPEPLIRELWEKLIGTELEIREG